ncbi:AraC family transcriptional regulator [Chthonobacter rhizosphaerae]|uniref:AraC family transcriptional regulator n=1 Tax=Chthonobacter rhizosphaerae TaxID=2735553 RepID=UPI0015EF184E|nr:AraC family transcriptional regulator [Chthonobacter rhizosphaerae]
MTEAPTTTDALTGPGDGKPFARRIDLSSPGERLDRASVETFNRRFSETVLAVDVEPLALGPMRARVDLVLGGPVFVAYYQLSAIAFSRASRHTAADEDCVTVNLVTEGVLSASSGGSGFDLRPWQVAVLNTARPSRVAVPAGGGFIGIKIAKADLRSRGVDAERIGGQLGPTDANCLGLLKGYLDTLRSSGPALLDRLGPTAGRHVADLVAATLRPEAPDVSGRDGIRAARRQRLRDLIVERHADPDLDLAAVAGAMGMSVRSVQMLLEEDGDTFSDRLREIRVARAADLIRRPDGAERISDVAFAVGFHDLSTFNRAFRRRFGVTPRDYRAGVADMPSSGT